MKKYTTLFKFYFCAVLAVTTSASAQNSDKQINNPENNHSGNLTVLRSAACDNADFEKGNFTNWINPSYGSSSGGVYTPIASGFIYPHFLLTTPNDTDSCSGLPAVRPNGGGNYAIRIGDSAVAGAKAARVSYVFTPSASAYLFTFYYSMLIKHSNFHTSDGAKLEVDLISTSTSVSIPCNKFIMMPGPNIPGYNLSLNCLNDIYYCNWTPICIDLKKYIGTPIEIRFTVFDCSEGSGMHYGYTYLDADCSEPDLTDTTTINNPIQLCAPEGYDTYTQMYWLDSNNTVIGNTRCIQVSSSVAGIGKYKCIRSNLFSGNGLCKDTLTYTVVYQGSSSVVAYTQLNNFSFYPNPATDELVFETENKFAEIIITDIIGNIVLQSEYNEKISIRSLSKGVYTLRLINKEGVSTKSVKLIKAE